MRFFCRKKYRYEDREIFLEHKRLQLRRRNAQLAEEMDVLSRNAKRVGYFAFLSKPSPNCILLYRRNSRNRKINKLVEN